MQISSSPPLQPVQFNMAEKTARTDDVEAAHTASPAAASADKVEITPLDPLELKNPIAGVLAKFEDRLSGAAWEKVYRTFLEPAPATPEITLEDAERFAKLADKLSTSELEDLVSVTTGALHGARAIDPRFGTMSGSVSFHFSGMMDAFESLSDEDLGRALDIGAGFNSNAVLIDERMGKDFVTRDSQELAARNFISALSNAENAVDVIDALEPWDQAQQVSLTELMVADTEAGVNLATDLQQYDPQQSVKVINFLDMQLEKRVAKLEGETDGPKSATVKGRANSESWDDRFASSVNTTIRQMSALVHDYVLDDRAFTAVTESVMGHGKPENQRAALEVVTQSLKLQTEQMRNEAVASGKGDQPLNLKGKGEIVAQATTLLKSEKLLETVVDAKFSGNDINVGSLVKLASVAVEDVVQKGGNTAAAKEKLDAFFGQVATLQDGVNRLEEDAGEIQWEGAIGVATKDERTDTIEALAQNIDHWVPGEDLNTSLVAEVTGKIDKVAEGRDVRAVLDAEEHTRKVVHSVSDEVLKQSPEESDDPMAGLMERYSKQVYNLGPDLKPGTPEYDAAKALLMADVEMALKMPGTDDPKLKAWEQSRADQMAQADQKAASLDVTNLGVMKYLAVESLLETF